jgi:malate dehydrogenase (oxaloacetate-decarboxylating)
VLSFNDDIQGTGCVALAALITAMRIKKQRFSDQRFVIVGMGQAGVGIASNIRMMLVEEGLSEEEARNHIFAYDVPGILCEDSPGLARPQLPFTQKRAAIAGWKLETPGKVSLNDVVRNSKATVLIGVTATTGLFNQEILASMAANDDRPVIFALSNPTSKTECTPEEVAEATNGRGLVATGSPFAPFEFNKQPFVTSQCNNMFIFPGVGLGGLVSKSAKITTKMFLKASKALSDLVTEEQRKQNMLLPDLNDIRNVSYRVALAVAIEARDSGLGRLLSDEEYAHVIKKAQWEPHYYPYRPHDGD